MVSLVAFEQRNEWYGQVQNLPGEVSDAESAQLKRTNRQLKLLFAALLYVQMWLEMWLSSILLYRPIATSANLYKETN